MLVENRETLETIGRKLGTDKSSILHDFLNFYEAHLHFLRNENFVLVEVGVYQGGSLRMWGDYFRNATIVGLDINPIAAEVVLLPNTHVCIGDAFDPTFLTSIIERYGQPLVVIDDGSHYWRHQIMALHHLWPTLRHGGIFIMEDIHTSFPDAGSEFGMPDETTCYDYLVRLQRWIVGNRYMTKEPAPDAFIGSQWPSFKSIAFARGTCIMHRG